MQLACATCISTAILQANPGYPLLVFASTCSRTENTGDKCHGVFMAVGCPSCQPTNSTKVSKETHHIISASTTNLRRLSLCIWRFTSNYSFLCHINN